MSISKKELYDLIDQIPESETGEVKCLLEMLLKKAKKRKEFKEFLDNCPIDDEPLTDEDLEAIKEAEADIAAGRVYSFEDVKKELGL